MDTDLSLAGAQAGLVRALLFDLDDTLYDRGHAFRAWATAFVAARLAEVDESGRREAVELLVAWDARGYCTRAALFARIQERYGCLPTTVEEMATSFPEQLCRYIVLEQETEGLLAALDAWGLPFGIVTNGSAGQRLKVEALGLHERTSCIFISSLCGVRKPEPAIFLAAAACLGVPPREILFVGDNPDADILGARAVGMHTAWVPRGQSWPAHLGPPCADLTVRSLTELASALQVAGWCGRRGVPDPAC